MITSYVQLLQKRYGDKLDDNAREYISFAVDGSNRLKKMMDDLLTYSRIGRPDINPEQINPAELIEKVKKVIDSNYPAGNHKINCRFPENMNIHADKKLILKLFHNILDNALKFNNSKEQIIEIAADENEKEWIFSVKDNGMGIEREYHGKVFGIFQKLHNHSEYPGSGIGLAICEKIVSRHNGKIWIDSDAGRGATFHVSINKVKHS
ncbi:MAG: GHKL domain-containing protein [Ignavibacteria bacterium]|nr:GHKL domain-containing protein [Ignavibacteria bacterium]MCC7159441.1 GHKL domain-containing protein [Ignavibacteria bacterium]